MGDKNAIMNNMGLDYYGSVLLRAIIGKSFHFSASYGSTRVVELEIINACKLWHLEI